MTKGLSLFRAGKGGLALGGLLLLVGDHHVDGQDDGHGGNGDGAVEGLLIGGVTGLGVVEDGRDGLADPGGGGVAQEHDSVIDAQVGGTKRAAGQRRVDDQQGAEAEAQQGQGHEERALVEARGHEHEDEAGGRGGAGGASLARRRGPRSQRRRW